MSTILKRQIMRKIAIFASGQGSNAENIIRHFSSSNNIDIALVLTNNPSAGVINKCKKLGVECRIFNRIEFRDSDVILKLLEDTKIDYIVLAGFLWLVPDSIVNKWSERIVNIHPSLLPRFGGKGMHGERVHQAVIESGDKESGITIHQVDGIFDNGSVMFQAKVEVTPSDTPETLAEKIHILEQNFFPKVIEELIGEM